MRITAIVNQKGGCGKTTTAINLAAIYARRGLRTLLVDVDPQSHCAAGLGVPEERIEYTIADAMLDNEPVDPARLVWEVARNLYLAPSTMRLAALEAPGGGLHERPDRDRRLATVLERVGSHYDRCLIDCPPTIGLLTFNAMRAAREVLVPVETGYFALKGAERQWETIQRVIKRLSRPIASHILATLHDPSSELARDILHALRRRFAGQIVPVVIREHEALREAASMGQPVAEFAPHSEARSDYEALADWLEAHKVAPIPGIETFEMRTSPSAGGQPPGRAAELVRRMRTSAQATAPFGVHKTPLGVRFVQPDDGRLRSLVGAFNGWNAGATPFVRNTRRGVVETLIDLPPGRHEYAIIVGGEWEADPFNDKREADASGQERSVIEVAAAGVAGEMQ